MVITDMELTSLKTKVGFFVFLALSLLPRLSSAQEVTQKAAFTIGESLEFHSRILDENRVLNIYLPLSYAQQTDKKYPVIYLLDGSADEDFIHIAGLVQFGSFPWIEMIPETIVVGIANVDRKRDFTFPSKNEKDQKELPTSGGSARFIEALAKEIQPLIRKTYRTQDVSTIIGQSLGGLLATEILYTRPDLFDNYIIVSPSLWWDDRSLLKAGPKNLAEGTSIFVGVGKEGEIMEEVAAELHRKIDGAKAAGTRLWFRHFPELDHGDTLHLAVYEAFGALFKTSSP